MPALDSFVWASAGIEPATEEDAIYTAGDQPIAGYDNFIMWAVTSDVHAINDYAISHASDHESGGSQELDLDGLEIGDVGSIDADGTTFGLSGTVEDALRYDNNLRAITSLAEVRNGIDSHGTVRLNDDVETYGGTTLYDAQSGWFHRAENAQNADWADEAGDAETLGGRGVGEFLFPENDETVDGEWTFGPTVHADIDGHAASSSIAYVAELAEDSELLDGWTREEILDAAWQQVSGEFTDIQDDGDLIVEDAAAVNAGTSIDVTDDGPVATLDVTSVPHADEADQAANSALLEQNSTEDILDMAWQDVQDEFVDVLDDNDMVVNNASSIDGGTSVEVSNPIGDIARLDVNSVPHADEADDADHADTADQSDDSSHLEGWTRSEIIAAAQSNINRVWEPIETFDETNAISFSPDTVYDRYRLLIHFERGPGGPEQDHVRLQLNGDTRSRYHYFGAERDGETWDDEVFYGRQHFPVARTFEDKRTVAEYIINSPELIGNMEGENAYPTIAQWSVGTDPYVGRVLKYGALDTHTPNGVDTIDLSYPSDRDGSFEVTVYAQDIHPDL